MYLKIVYVVFFVCTRNLSNSIDLDKYELNNDHVPSLPEYYDWEPIPTSAFENEFTKPNFENEENTHSSNDTPDSQEDEDEDVVLEDEKEVDEKDDDIVEDVYFAGPVKAKGTVTVGANFGYGSSYPIPYPWFPPYFYNPFHPPYPYYFPYLSPDPNTLCDELARKYYEIASNKQSGRAEDNLREESSCKSSEESKEIHNSGYNAPVSDNGIPISDNGNEVGKVFGGFVPASGNVKIFAQF